MQSDEYRSSLVTKVDMQEEVIWKLETYVKSDLEARLSKVEEMMDSMTEVKESEDGDVKMLQTMEEEMHKIKWE